VGSGYPRFCSFAPTSELMKNEQVFPDVTSDFLGRVRVQHLAYSGLFETPKIAKTHCLLRSIVAAQETISAQSARSDQRKLIPIEWKAPAKGKIVMCGRYRRTASEEETGAGVPNSDSAAKGEILQALNGSASRKG
jgi:hypothetical protein